MPTKGRLFRFGKIIPYCNKPRYFSPTVVRHCLNPILRYFDMQPFPTGDGEPPECIPKGLQLPDPSGVRPAVGATGDDVPGRHADRESL